MFKIKSTDELPTSACHNCLAVLHQFDKFCEMVVETQDKLRLPLKQNRTVRYLELNFSTYNLNFLYTCIKLITDALQRNNRTCITSPAVCSLTLQMFSARCREIGSAFKKMTPYVVIRVICFSCVCLHFFLSS